MTKCGALIALMLVFPACALESSDFWILTNPEPPLVELDEKNQLKGYVVDVVRGILKEAGIEQEILTAPWERVEKEARIKSNVLVFALARTQDREQNYHWITPITANVFTLYVRKSANKEIRQISDLGKLTGISVLEKDARHRLLQKIAPQVSMPFADWQSALSSVIKGEAQGIFFSDAGMAFYCSLSAYECGDLERQLIYRKTASYLVLSKFGTNPDLAVRLQEAAMRFKASEEFRQLGEYWLNKYKDEAPFPMHLEDGTLNLWKK